MSEGQVQNDQISILNNLVQSLLQLMGPAAPAIIPGALYIRSQVESNLQVSDKTVTWWKDNGLRSFKPATSKDLFLGDDIIEFAKNNPKLLAPANYKEQQAQRAKVRGNGTEEKAKKGTPRKRGGGGKPTT